MALFCVLLIPGSFFLTVYFCCKPSQWWWFLPYFSYCLLDRSPWRGSRPLEWVRRAKAWVHFADYFPTSVELEKPDAKFDADAPYLFGCHPHGIISMGWFANIGTEARNISQVIPGVDIRLATLATSMRLPFLRDILLSLNFIAVDRQAISHVLKMGKGNAVGVVVGGATEALYSKPDCHALVLKRRRGFFREALIHGAHVVPCYSFGETDIYKLKEVAPQTQVAKFRSAFQKLSGVSMPLAYGRGIFQYWWGFIPFRRPINLVIGEPIAVEKRANPTDAEVAALQEQYLGRLTRLFDSYKHKYCVDPDNAHIHFVE
eukprot:GDKI01020012.1.p1 GENE.GDKI01020012.1~~GDKI01020012.1.p1  ORF type:complete len:317 (-),score=78.27 GDKI01020012.1:82-1032(-)